MSGDSDLHYLTSTGVKREGHSNSQQGIIFTLKQHIILDTVKCYLRHLVSKETRRVYLECTKLRQKKKVLIILMELLQLVKVK